MCGATASCNTALGYLALAVSSGVSNTAVGLRSLVSNTTGSSNAAVGNCALANNTTGANNTAVGKDSLKTNTTA